MSYDIEDILSQLQEVVPEEQPETEGEEVSAEPEGGISEPPEGIISELANSLGRDQGLAEELWQSDTTNARLLAAWVADPAKQTKKGMKAWIKEVDNKALADQLARFLLCLTDQRLDLIEEYTSSKDAFAKRIGFGTMACTMLENPEQSSDVVEGWLERIAAGAEDDREEVRDAVLWALLEIGKVDEYWQDAAIVLACELQAEGQTAAALGHEAEEILSGIVAGGDRRRLMSGNNSKTAKNQNNQSQNSKRRSGGKNNRRGRGQQNQNNGGSSDAKKPARRNGRNKRRSRGAASKTV